jgi:hypothetical protein
VTATTTTTPPPQRLPGLAAAAILETGGIAPIQCRAHEAAALVDLDLHRCPVLCPPPARSPPQVIIGFTTLVVLGLVGIIVYATLNPNQSIFTVPDAVIPSIPGVTTPSSTPQATPSPTAAR